MSFLVKKLPPVLEAPQIGGPSRLEGLGVSIGGGDRALRASKNSRFLSNMYFRPLIGEKMSLHLQRSAKYGPTTCRQVAGG